MGEPLFTDLVPADKQAELEGKHGELQALRHRSKPLAVLLREPKRGEYKMWRAASHDPKKVADAQEVLFRQICVFPETPAEVEQLMDQWIGVAEASSEAIDRLTGLTGVIQGKG